MGYVHVPVGYSDRVRDIARYFDHDHLPARVQAVARVSASLAAAMIKDLPDGMQLEEGLQLLLMAKDCFVRQAIHHGVQE